METFEDTKKLKACFKVSETSIGYFLFLVLRLIMKLSHLTILNGSLSILN